MSGLHNVGDSGDIVQRLRWLQDEFADNYVGDDVKMAADKIERMRSAGDALAASLRSPRPPRSTHRSSTQRNTDRLRAWQEARRG